MQRPFDVTSFMFSKSFYSVSYLFKRANKYGSVFPYTLERTIYETKFPTHISFLFSTFYLSYHFNFYFGVQDLPFLRDPSHVIMLPVSC